MASINTLATLDFQPLTSAAGQALEALCWRLRDDDGEYWQAVRLWRVREIKKFFKQIASLEELSDDFVSSLYDPAGQGHINALFSLANVLSPRLGIFQMFGVRGFGPTMQAALDATAGPAWAMRATFEGKFRQSIIEPLEMDDAAAWLAHLAACSQVGVMLGHPVPRKMSSGGDLDGGLNRLSSLEAAEQMEVVAAACAEIPFALNFFVDPLHFGEINAMLRDTLRELGKMKAESAATQSASVSMVLPALAVPNMSYQQAATRETASSQDAARQHAEALGELSRFNISAARSDTTSHAAQQQVYQASEHYTDAEHRVTSQQGAEHVTQQAREHVATDQMSREDWFLARQYAGAEHGVIADSKVTHTDTAGVRTSDAHVLENTQSFEHRQVATTSAGQDHIAQRDLYGQAEAGTRDTQYHAGEAGQRQINFQEAGQKNSQYQFGEQGFRNTQYGFGESGFLNKQFTGAEAGSRNTQYGFAEGGTQSGAGSSHQATTFDNQQITSGAMGSAQHSATLSGYSDASQRQSDLSQNTSQNAHSQTNSQTGMQTAQGAITGEAGFGVKGANISGQLGIPGLANVNVGASGGPHGDLSVSGSLSAQQQNQQQSQDFAQTGSSHTQQDGANTLQGVRSEQTAQNVAGQYADAHAQSGAQNQNVQSSFANSYANAGSGTRSEAYQNAFAGSLNTNYQTGGAGFRNETYQTGGEGWRNEQYQLQGQRNEQYAQLADGFRQEAFQTQLSGARGDVIDRAYQSARFDDMGIASQIQSVTHRQSVEGYTDSNAQAQQSLEQYSKAFAGTYAEAGTRLGHLQTDALIQREAESAAQFQRSTAQQTTGEGVSGREGTQRAVNDGTLAQGTTQSASERELSLGTGQTATTAGGASVTQGASRLIASGFTAGGSPSLVAGMGLSRVTYDEQKAALARLLATQADRLTRGQTGGMYLAHVYLGAQNGADLDALGRALVAALREDEVVQPIQIRRFDPATTSRLHRHQLALTPWRVGDDIHPLEPEALATVLTADEMGALVHPLRIDGMGGISTTVDALPTGLATPANLRGQMMWGRVVSPTNGRVTETEYRVGAESLMHLTLVGGSGSGKSNSAMHILGQVFTIRESSAGQAAIGATVFDPTGEWRRMARLVPDAGEFRFYSLTDPACHPLLFNPLRVPSPHISPGAWAEMVAKRWALAYATGSTGYYAIKSAILRIYQDKGVIDPKTGATRWQASADISIADLYAFLDETRSEKAKARSKADISIGVIDRILEKWPII